MQITRLLNGIILQSTARCEQTTQTKPKSTFLCQQMKKEHGGETFYKNEKVK